MVFEDFGDCFDNPENAKNYFDAHVNIDDEYYNVKYESNTSLHAIFNSKIKLKKEDVILDFGCGFGRLAKILYEKIKEYYGLDISIERIKICEKNYGSFSNTFFKVCSGDSIPYKDGFFDVVVANTVFQHIGKNLTKLLVMEIYRVLKPSGFFIINFPKKSFYKNYGYTNDEIKDLLNDFDYEVLIPEEGFTKNPKIVNEAYYYLLGGKKDEKNNQ